MVFFSYLDTEGIHTEIRERMFLPIRLRIALDERPIASHIGYPVHAI